MQHIVLLGCSGSGKSLVASCLVRADGIVFATESILPTCLAGLVNLDIKSEHRTALVKGIVEHFRVFPTTGGFESRLQTSVQFLRGNIPLPEFWNRLASKKPTFDTFLFESNFYSLAPDFLQEAFPDAKFVFMVRDGRESAHRLSTKYQAFCDPHLKTANSSEGSFSRNHNGYWIPWWVESGQEQDFIAASAFVRSIWLWKSMTDRCDDFAKRNPQSSYVLRHEDLMSNPQFHMSELLDFLQLSPKNRIISRSKKFTAPNTIAHQEYSNDEIAAAENVAKDALQRHGYL